MYGTTDFLQAFKGYSLPSVRVTGIIQMCLLRGRLQRSFLQDANSCLPEFLLQRLPSGILSLDLNFADRDQVCALVLLVLGNQWRSRGKARVVRANAGRDKEQIDKRVEKEAKWKSLRECVNGAGMHHKTGDVIFRNTALKSLGRKDGGQLRYT